MDGMSQQELERLVEVVDVTGAGNAYCGGFLVGYVETGDVRMAAMYGAVSASFAVEQFGIPRITAETEQEARHRLAALEKRVLRRAASLTTALSARSESPAPALG